MQAARKKKQQAQNQAHYKTVGDWLREWFPLHAANVKPSSAQTYKHVLHRRVRSTPFAELPLAAVERRDVAQWWDNLTLQQGRVSRDQYAAYTLLRTAFQAAVDRDMIPTNPVKLAYAHRPKAHRKELPEYDTMLAITNNLRPVSNFVELKTP